MISQTRDVVKTFPDIDSAFVHISDVLMKEGDVTKDEIGGIIDPVKDIYIKNGHPGNFNVWEIENDNGELLRMFINEVQ